MLYSDTNADAISIIPTVFPTCYMILFSRTYSILPRIQEMILNLESSGDSLNNPKNNLELVRWKPYFETLYLVTNPEFRFKYRIFRRTD
jgi:hypothetical protein